MFCTGHDVLCTAAYQGNGEIRMNDENRMTRDSSRTTERGDVTRRQFATRAIIGGAAAAAGLAFANTETLVAQAKLTDIDILNFALNLEYLEAEFYTVATSGQRIQEAGIEITGRGRQGATVGGAKVALDDQVRVVAEQIAIDERAHVAFLRTALKGDAVAKPDINLEALGLGFRDQNEFLTLARAFEDVGVSAYAGAAALIDDSTILAAAARIALTEAQHAGVLRLLAYQKALTIAPVDGQDVPTLGSPNGRLFFVDGNGLSIARTADKVLRIVYGGGTNEGGFFPTGVNGTIERA